jgi:hypothetical protein
MGGIRFRMTRRFGKDDLENSQQADCAPVAQTFVARVCQCTNLCKESQNSICKRCMESMMLVHRAGIW